MLQIENIHIYSLQTSDPSETIVAWTDPIVPAYAEPPAVHPNEGLKEGDAMTILCISMGTPTPTVFVLFFLINIYYIYF